MKQATKTEKELLIEQIVEQLLKMEKWQYKDEYMTGKSAKFGWKRRGYNWALRDIHEYLRSIK